MIWSLMICWKHTLPSDPTYTLALWTCSRCCWFPSLMLQVATRWHRCFREESRRLSSRSREPEVASFRPIIVGSIADIITIPSTMVWKTIRETDFGVVEDAQYSTLLYSLPASIHVHGVGGTLDPPDMVNMLFFKICSQSLFHVYI